jgi:hypothetical protein|tara:strand:+ start:498 stop:1421 length:924 start_codon:yes stop_codon:yes gene_type:complete
VKSLTLFKSVFDNKTHKRIDCSSYAEFEKLLFDLADQPRKDKKSAPLISPATYKPDTTRANDNVIGWAGWCAVDVDEHVFDGELEKELLNAYGTWNHVVYSTASSTKEHPKFRIVFPLTEDVPKDKIKHFWFALNKTLGDIGDPQTKDLSRMYYVPGQYEDAYNFIYNNFSATDMNPYDIMAKHDYVERQGTLLDNLPPAIKKAMLSHRKNEMTNTNITWNNYKDCPFVNKKMVKEYNLITDTGWYTKMYGIMVSIAGNAIRKKYPITAGEITTLCKEIDYENGNWYKSRPFDKEADRAIEFVYGNL